MTAKRMKSLVCMIVAAAMSTLVATPVDAFSRKVQKACKGDYKRLCPHYKPNTPQMRACMEAKSSEISGVCINALIDDGVVDRRRGR